MNIKSIIGLTICILALSSCKNRKSELIPVEISFKYAQEYCGGEPAPPEVMDSLMKLRPYANSTLYMADPNSISERAVKVPTNGKGIAKLNLKEGEYAFFAYDPVAVIKESMELQQKDPTIECTPEWKLGMSSTVNIVAGDAVHEIFILFSCDPCAPQP